MNEIVRIEVFEIVGSSLCVHSDDGQAVHDHIAVALRRGKCVELSFHNTERIAPEFLNAAVGQLYGEFSEEQIATNVSMIKIGPDDAALLTRSINLAKQYFGELKDSLGMER